MILLWRCATSVSYTHLDVYKRQGREPAKDGMPRKSEDAGQHDGNHDGFLHDVFSHKEGCVRSVSYTHLLWRAAM